MSEICAAFGRLGGLVVAASFMVGTSLAVAQEAFAPGLCVVPVKNSASISLKDEWPMAPFPKPILKGGFPYERLSLWTVSANNALEPLGDNFPSSWLDKYTTEAPSGRVLGIASPGFRDAIYAFDPPSGRFRPILSVPHRASDGTGFRFAYTIAYVPRLGVTLIGTDNGVFRLRGEEVEPWAGATGREVGKVLSIADLPVHGALMLAGSKDALLRHDDGSVEKLLDTSGGWFSREDQVTGAVESKQPGRIVAKGVFADREVEMRPRRGGGFSSSNDWILARHPDQGGNTVQRLTRSGEYLLLRRTAWSGEYVLKRLEADGMHAVPGDPIPALLAKPWEGAVMAESTALGLVLIGVKGGWYSYDGDRVAFVAGSEPAAPGIQSLPTDMPSIGRTLLNAIDGLFEFTADRRLVRVALPFPHSDIQSLSELAPAGIGLIATKDNLYALTRSGVIRPIQGANSDAYDFLSLRGPLPGREAMLVHGRTNLHLVVQGSSCPGPAPVAP